MAPADDSNNPFQARLWKAAKELETAIGFQEKGTLRIIQLAEYLESTSLDNYAKMQIRAIIETCGFQDLTGQRIRNVINGLNGLADEVKDMDTGAMAEPEEETKGNKLSQDEINRLLAGEDVKKVKGLS